MDDYNNEQQEQFMSNGNNGGDNYDGQDLDNRLQSALQGFGDPNDSGTGGYKLNDQEVPPQPDDIDAPPAPDDQVDELPALNGESIIHQVAPPVNESNTDDDNQHLNNAVGGYMAQPGGGDINIVENSGVVDDMKNGVETVHLRNDYDNTFAVRDCAVESVTVYLDKAEVRRHSRPYLTTKVFNEVIFKDFSPFTEKDSLRVDKIGNATIQDVNIIYGKVDDEESLEYQRIVRDLKTKLKRELRHKDGLMTKKARMETARNILNSCADSMNDASLLSNGGAFNKATEAASKEVDKTLSEQQRQANRYDPTSIDTLKNFLDVYEQQTDRLDDGILSLTEELEAVEMKIADITESIKTVELRREETCIREMRILIEAGTDGEIDLYLSYVVGNASWVPCYDVRIYNDDGQIKIIYYGMIQQATNEDWGNCRLALSSSAPGVGGIVPELSAQKMTYKSSKLAGVDGLAGGKLGKGKDSKSMRKSNRQSMAVVDEPANNVAIAGLPGSHSPATAAREITKHPSLDLEQGAFNETSSGFGTLSRESQFFQLREISGAGGLGAGLPVKRSEYAQQKNLISVRYDIPRPPHCISGDDASHRVTIGIVDLQPVFDYVTAPRKSPNAYIRATMQNNSRFAFLPGATNIYVDNNFIGKSELPMVSPLEDFTCDLGVDSAIKVKYLPLNKHKESGSQSAKVINYSFKQVIQLQNTHRKPIKLQVLDVMPISGEDKLKVNLLEPQIKHPEKYDKSKPIRINKSNIIEWDLELGIDEQREIVIRYSVEYPAAEEVVLNDIVA